MASRGYQKRSYHGGRRQHSNPHPRYQPLPPIPLPPRPGQSELSSPFQASTHGGDFNQFQFLEQIHGKGRYGFSSSSYLHRGRGKGSYQKSYAEDTNIAEYYNQSMLEDPWGQLIEEFNQSDVIEPELGPTCKPTDIQFGTIRDKSFSRIQNRNQDMADTPLSEYGTEFIGPQFDTSPLEPAREEEPYIPSMPREDQLEISLADDLISPFGAHEWKGISSLSTNEITALESEPYVPSGYSENNTILEPYSPLKSVLVSDSDTYQPYSPGKQEMNVEN